MTKELTTPIPDWLQKVIEDAPDDDGGGMKSMPPMESKTLKNGNTFKSTSVHYPLRIEKMEHKKGTNVDYLQMTLRFAEEKDIAAFGDWEIKDFYSYSQKAQFNQTRLKHLFQNLKLPFSGEGSEGLIVRAILGTRYYTDLEGNERESLRVVRLAEWSKPTAQSASVLFQQGKETPPAAPADLNDDIPF